MSSHQAGYGDVPGISPGPEVHRGNGPPITEQAERKQLPTNSMESGSATLHLFSGAQSWPQQWKRECTLSCQHGDGA